MGKTDDHSDGDLQIREGGTNLMVSAMYPMYIGSHPIQDDNRDDFTTFENITLYESIIQTNNKGRQLSSIELFNLNGIPTSLKHIMTGTACGLNQDHYVPINNRPDWLNIEMFKRGQKFALDNYFSLNLSEMLSLYILFSFPNSLGPLIFTQNSNTPFTAFKRYLSTVNRVKSWYSGDIWNANDEAFKNLKTVRSLHLNVSNKLNSVPKDEIWQKCVLENVMDPSCIWSPLNNMLRKEFENTFKNSLNGLCPFKMNANCVFLNQTEMSLTQFGFMGLIILYPNKFGITEATDEDFEGFIHLWKYLGYLLGIEDRYNFCNGTLIEVRQRCEDLINFWVKPHLMCVSKDWEHMSRCMTEGISYFVPGITFETSLLFLCWVLDADAPQLHNTLTWGQEFMFGLMKITMCFILKLPGMRGILNGRVTQQIKNITMVSPETIEKLNKKSYHFSPRNAIAHAYTYIIVFVISLLVYKTT